ncbi:MAG: hypothetical protein HQL65_07895 [Magnetococcales bacterium]|nr:hypothetical protein [Magnetococcales bacterium]
MTISDFGTGLGVTLPWLLYSLLAIGAFDNFLAITIQETLLRLFGLFYLLFVLSVKIISKILISKAIPESILVGSIIFMFVHILFWILIVAKGGV